MLCDALCRYSFLCASQIVSTYSSVFVYSSMLSAMVLPVASALRATAAPPESSVDRWLPWVPRWVRTKLSRPQSLLEKLQSKHVDIEAPISSLSKAALLVEACRMHLGVSEFFARWFRNVAVILVMGSLNPLVAAPVFVGSVVETCTYSARLNEALNEIKSSSGRLHEVKLLCQGFDFFTSMTLITCL